MRRGSYISVSFSSFLVNLGSFIMYFSIALRIRADESIALSHCRTRSTSFLRGGDEEGSLYLGEFPLVSCELGFVFNVFSCRLKDQRRREHCASSFSYQINFFPRWEMRRGSYISVGFSSFLVNSGSFLMYFSVVSRF